MAGDYRSKKEAAYLLVPAVGRKVIDLGGNLEKGVEILLPVKLFMRLIRALAPILKLIGNSLILGIIEVMSESITMGEKAGIGAPAVLGVINGKLLRSLAHACISRFSIRSLPEHSVCYSLFSRISASLNSF